MAVQSLAEIMVSSYSRSFGTVVVTEKYVTTGTHDSATVSSIRARGEPRLTKMRHRPSSSRGQKLPGHFTGGLDEEPAKEPLPPRIGERPGTSTRPAPGKTKEDDDYVDETPAKTTKAKTKKASPSEKASPGPVHAEKAMVMTVVQFNDAIQMATNQAVTKILAEAGNEVLASSSSAGRRSRQTPQANEHGQRATKQMLNRYMNGLISIQLISNGSVSAKAADAALRSNKLIEGTATFFSDHLVTTAEVRS